MTNEEKIKLLNQQIEKSRELENQRYDNPEHTEWQNFTSTVIRKIFGDNSPEESQFKKIRYRTVVTERSPWADAQCQDAYIRGHQHAQQILLSLIKELKTFPSSEPDKETVSTNLPIRLILEKFHAIQRQLRSRHDNRPTLEIADEYDVQNLLHALMRLVTDDIRTEEWTPSYAGCCSRMDFLLKDEQTVIETKMTRKGLGPKEVGEQLIIDIARYKNHPDCKILICFVYDPTGLIANPASLENDLSKDSEGLSVTVLVRPKA